MQTIQIEVTDTFGGESNYSWVRRFTAEVPDNAKQREIVRAAKKAADWCIGAKHQTENYGDMIAIRPYGVCQVMFITFE